MDVTLKGEFVTLRPLALADAADTLRWRLGPRAIHLPYGAQTLAQQTEWIASRPASEYNFIIALKNGLAVGMVSLLDVNPVHRRAEPGRFLIGEEAAARGMPVAVEAMKLVYALAFDELQLLRVFGTIATGNLLMIKWQKYLGMKEEGRLRQHYFINGRWQDVIVFGLLAEEYRTVALPRMNGLIAAGRRSTPKPSDIIVN